MMQLLYIDDGRFKQTFPNFNISKTEICFELFHYLIPQPRLICKIEVLYIV